MSVRSLNKVMLIGNLTRDPELRYTPSGTAVCNFGLATNRQWTATDGTTQEATEFHRIVAWAKLAEICSQLLFKGRKVYIEGRLQTREWTAADGSKQRTTEVVTDTMMILDSKKKEGEMEAVEVVEPSGQVAEAEEAPLVSGAEESPEEGAEMIKAATQKADSGQAAAIQPGSTTAKSSKSDQDEEEKEDKKIKVKDKEEVKVEDLPF